MNSENQGEKGDGDWMLYTRGTEKLEIEMSLWKVGREFDRFDCICM